MACRMANELPACAARKLGVATTARPPIAVVTADRTFSTSECGVVKISTESSRPSRPEIRCASASGAMMKCASFSRRAAGPSTTATAVTRVGPTST